MTVEQWGLFEFALNGPQDGNPFVDVAFGARFRFQHREINVAGFYDGGGVYRVRFMPDMPGEWEYVTHSSAPGLDNVAGKFICIAPSPRNHGPVRVHNTYHFAYADGTPYWQVGTTCYAWTHQGEALEEQTLATLKTAPFNKMRMCVFPKHYTFNANEPEYYPFERLENGAWNFERFNPAFFQHFERRVADLLALGIEADVILFHPYDRWGFATMDAESDDRYLRYIVARLAAYRNVWWSMANEWDLMQAKSLADWDRFFRIVQENDPYQHLRSIHNGRTFYDHNKPWVTHASVQIVGTNMNLEPILDWHKQYKKPIIIDECCYEGNIPDRWGNITPQEMVRRFWESTIHGAYAGHGETYLHPQDILWWSKGGLLHGQSPERIAFYQRILDETPSEGLEPLDGGIHSFKWAGVPGRYYLAYFGVHQPGRASFDLLEGQYQVEIIDTWEMTITPLPPFETGKFQIELPSKPYMAVRVRRVIT
jgi:Domain of unknown function (DUF5060)/Domain of unknown function (DUF5605)/Protein of unknown function (DUF4038)